MTYGDTCACSCGHSRRGSVPDASHETPAYDPQDPRCGDSYCPEVLNTIDSTIQELDPDLRQLSLDIWGKRSGPDVASRIEFFLLILEHPEVGFEEQYVLPCRDSVGRSTDATPQLCARYADGVHDPPRVYCYEALPRSQYRLAR